MAKTPVLHVPLITPLAPDGSLDAGSLARLARQVLDDGAAGVVLFGTLGEAQSFSAAERKAGLDALLSGGVAPERIMVGIGAAALTDVTDLSHHAAAAGCLRQLLLPPFLFKGVSEEGLFRFIAAVIEGANDAGLRLTLYDIPGLVGVPISQPVIFRLIDRFGPVIAGLKDSVPDWAHVETSLKSFPDLDIFVGNEIFLPQALALGGAGAISGLGNLATAEMAALLRPGLAEDDPDFDAMCALYHRISRHPVVPAVKALTARARNDAALAHVRLPLVGFDLDTAPDILEAAEAFLSRPLRQPG